MSIEDEMSLEGITKRQQAICDLALKEGRGFTPEEEHEYDHWDEVYKRNHASLNNGAIRPVPLKQGREIEAEARRKKAMTTENTSVFDADGYKFDAKGKTQRDIFNRYIKYGADAIGHEEYRALQADKDVAGGFLTVPTEVSKTIFADLDNELFVRQLATIIKVPHAESFRIPKMADDFGSPTWTQELGSGSEDSQLDFQAYNFEPRPIARRIKISYDLLRISTLNPESFVRQRMTQVLSQVLENAYLQGAGPGPLGLFVASDSGISTARDITASSATEIKYDDLISAIGALKYQFRRNAAWIVHRDVETQLRKLKDGSGRPLLENSIDGRRPPALLGFPLYTSEYSPSVMTSGRYVAILGDLKFYYVVDQTDFLIQRLEELYSETNQLGLIIRYSGTGGPITENAFCRIKLA